MDVKRKRTHEFVPAQIKDLEILHLKEFMRKKNMEVVMGKIKSAQLVQICQGFTSLAEIGSNPIRCHAGWAMGKTGLRAQAGHSLHNIQPTLPVRASCTHGELCIEQSRNITIFDR